MLTSRCAARALVAVTAAARSVTTPLSSLSLSPSSAAVTTTAAAAAATASLSTSSSSSTFASSSSSSSRTSSSTSLRAVAAWSSSSLLRASFASAAAPSTVTSSADAVAPPARQPGTPFASDDIAAAHKLFRPTSDGIRLRKDTYKEEHFDPRFLQKLMKLGPVGPRMKPRIKVPWHERNPGHVTHAQNALHLYRLVYARDHFQLMNHVNEREESFRSRPMKELRLPDYEPDWKKHVLMSVYQVAENHPHWSPGQRDDVLTAVFRLLKNDALWYRWGISLNYDMLADDDPFKPPDKFGPDGVTRISLNTPDVDAPILNPHQDLTPPKPPPPAKVRPNRAARMAATGLKRGPGPGRCKRPKRVMAKFRSGNNFKIKRYL